MYYAPSRRRVEYTFLKGEPITKSMVVLFHEHTLLLSTNNFIVIPIKYRNFSVYYIKKYLKKFQSLFKHMKICA
jgi:hypothetical protein